MSFSEEMNVIEIARIAESILASTMGFKLYKLDASPPARAVQMTLDILGIKDVETVDVNLFTGDHKKEDYTKMNPQHTIPTLVDDGFVIWDSHAIVTYLVTKYGKDDSLYPTDPKKRALVDQKLHFDTGVLFPALRLAVFPVFFGSDTALTQENLDRISAAYDLAELQFTNTWATGNQMTLADICCSATMSTLNEILPIDADKYPNITAWLGRMAKNDFYQKINVPGLKQIAEVLKKSLA